MYTIEHAQLTMSATMTIRLEADFKERLESLAQATQRSKSFIAAQAIRDYIENNEWQIAEVGAALDEASSGDFASASEIAAFGAKWRTNAG